MYKLFYSSFHKLYKVACPWSDRPLVSSGTRLLRDTCWFWLLAYHNGERRTTFVARTATNSAKTIYFVRCKITKLVVNGLMWSTKISAGGSHLQDIPTAITSLLLTFSEPGLLPTSWGCRVVNVSNCAFSCSIVLNSECFVQSMYCT